MKVKIGVSNRHVHLKEEDLMILFGKPLERVRDLIQPGEYASSFFVTLKTDKDIIEGVRVLGPIRKYSQVEISMTDAYKLGINPPVKSSGDLVGSSSITLIGPAGEVKLENGCIIANRHIHITHEDRVNMGLLEVEKVKVVVDTIKGGIMDNVYLKESDNFKLEFHIDTDDANAFLLKTGDEVTIIK